MISSKINVVLTFFCLIAYSSCSGAFENYDQKLYKISKENPSFSGFYIDESGNSILLLTTTEKKSKLEYSTFKSNFDLKKAIGSKLVTDLEKFYGGHRFLNEKRIQELYEIEGRYDYPINKIAVKVKHANYSFIELYHWFNQIYKDFNLLIEAKVNSIDIDEAKNKIVLGITDKKYLPKVENILVSYDIPKDAILIEERSEIVLTAKVTDKFNPLKAGTQIFENTRRNDFCSAGFIANLNNITGLFTNAHCTLRFAIPLDGTAIKQGNANNNLILGDSRFESIQTFNNCPSGYRCYNTDAAFIPIPPGVNVETTIVKTRYLNSSPVDLNLKTGRNASWRNLHIWENDPIAIGDTVYKTGATTGTTSAAIRGTCETTASVINGLTRIFNCVGRVSRGSGVFANGGDSGSALLGSIMGGLDFGNYTYRSGTHARILGLNFSGELTGSRPQAWFIPIESIIQEFGQITNQ